MLVSGVIDMGKDKTFPLKLSANKHGALKEQTHKHTTEEQVKIKVIFALDSELRLVEPVTFSDGDFSNIGSTSNQQEPTNKELNSNVIKTNQTIFYPLNRLSYICEHTVTLTRGEVVKNAVSLFIPTDIEKAKIICRDVSIMFPIHTRRTLAGNYLEYTLGRINEGV